MGYQRRVHGDSSGDSPLVSTHRLELTLDGQYWIGKDASRPVHTKRWPHPQGKVLVQLCLSIEGISIITEAITAQYPSTLEAAILTGFSTNTTALAPFLQGLNLAIANENQPARFFQLSNGYLVSSNIISQQIGFFRAPGFDPSILKLAELTKGSVTLGELFTQGMAAAPATQFNGPVAVVDGHEDFPFCFGNCSAPANKAQAVKALYP